MRARRRRADAERNRGRLLDAARAVFTEQGVDAPLELVAKRAGLGIATLYRNFPQRDDLIDAMVTDAIPAFEAIVAAALAHPDPWLGLVEFLENTCRHCAADRATHAVWRIRPATQRPVSGQARLLELAGQVLQRARDAGVVRADATDLDLACACLSVIHVMEVTAELDPPPWRRHLDLLLDGLRANPVGRATPAGPVTSADPETQIGTATPAGTATSSRP